MSEFNLDDFCHKYGIPNGELESYNYKKYKSINQKLTETMYRRMRESGALWKISIGRRHVDKYIDEVLEGDWRLQMIAKVQFGKL